MSFLGMGTFEILIILLVAFIFLGPERMIDAARTLGKWSGELRRMGSTVQAEMDDLTNVGAPLTSRYDQTRYSGDAKETTQSLDQDHPSDAPQRSDTEKTGVTAPVARDGAPGGDSRPLTGEGPSARREDGA